MKLTELNSFLMLNQRKYDLFVQIDGTLIDLEGYKGIRLNPNKKQIIIDMGYDVEFEKMDKMDKEKALAFLRAQREARLIGLDPDYESDFDKWQEEQAKIYQQVIDWIEKVVE